MRNITNRRTEIFPRRFRTTCPKYPLSWKNYPALLYCVVVIKFIVSHPHITSIARNDPHYIHWPRRWKNTRWYFRICRWTTYLLRFHHLFICCVWRGKNERWWLHNRRWMKVLRIVEISSTFGRRTERSPAGKNHSCVIPIDVYVYNLKMRLWINAYPHWPLSSFYIISLMRYNE